MENSPEKPLVALTIEDIEFISAASALALKFMDMGQSPCKVKLLLNDIKLVSTGGSRAEFGLKPETSICCSACIAFKNNLPKYLACIEDCDLGC